MKKQVGLPFFIFVISLVSILSLNTSCKKTTLFSKGNLAFSKDTVVFDTVFTTIGSTTQQLKIYNKESKTILIEEVELMGGSASPYRINLDGLMGTQFAGIELEGKDSLFLFVEVTLNPNGGNLPMVVEDSIRFRTNGKDQYVILAAWGQDMYYHYSDLNGSSQGWDLNEGVWPNDKPHVIYGAAFVDEDKTLTIPAGTKIHMHKNAFLYVYKGTLNIEGEPGNEVIIQGDRLEADYQDVSGQYYGVYFNEAKTSRIKHAIIKNGTSGIHIEKDGNNGSNPTVILENTKIQNHARYGIMNFAGGKVKAVNCVITHNGFHAIINLAGSGLDFTHCTIGSFGGGEGQLAALGISDFYNDGQGSIITSNIQASFKYCIIYGNKSAEIAYNLDNVGTNNFSFDYCAIRMEEPSSEPFYTNTIWNQNPKFKEIADWDFELLSDSPMIDAAIGSTSDFDIKGNARNGTPDIGAYEFQ